MKNIVITGLFLIILIALYQNNVFNLHDSTPESVRSIVDPNLQRGEEVLGAKIDDSSKIATTSPQVKKVIETKDTLTSWPQKQLAVFCVNVKIVCDQFQKWKK